MTVGTSERDIDRFFAVCPELLCILGAGGAFIRWNAAWESTLGHGAEEMAEMNFFDLVHPDDVGVTKAQFERFGGDGAPASVPVRLRLETRCRTRSGLHVRLSWALLSVPAEGLVYGSARNIDKQRRVERALMQRIEAKMQVASVSSHFIDARPSDLERCFDEALAHLGRDLDVDRCCLLLFGEDGETLLDARSWTNVGVAAAPGELAASPGELGWLLAQLRSGQAVVASRLDDLPVEAADARRFYEGQGVRSLLRVPAVYLGRVVGALGLEAVRVPRAWREGARALLSSVGELLAMTLERKRAEESLQRVVEQQDALRQVIVQQDVAIQTLSTPIIQVWDGILALPIVGAIDSRRAAEIMEKLLLRIVETQSRYAILELTGVEDVDPATAHHLLKMLRSIELLGARGVLAGIRPSIAQSINELGIDVSSFSVQRDLQNALRWCIGETARAPGSRLPLQRRVAGA